MSNPPMKKRAIISGLGVLLCVAIAFILFFGGPSVSWFPQCLLHRLTGLHCPGCGMTRALHALLHGDFLAAFRFNPVGMILFPVFLLGLSLEWIAWVRGKPLPFSLRTGVRGAWAIAILMLLFGILRNIPTWPFNLLAPP